MKRKGYPSGSMPALVQIRGFLAHCCETSDAVVYLVPQKCGHRSRHTDLRSLTVNRGGCRPTVACPFPCPVGEANRTGTGMWGRNRAGNQELWGCSRGWKCSGKRMGRGAVRGFLQWKERARMFKGKPLILTPTPTAPPPPTCQELFKPKVKVSCKEMRNTPFSVSTGGGCKKYSTSFSAKSWY